MDTHEKIINDQTRNYFSAASKNLLQIKNSMDTKINNIKNKNGYISLSINDMQQILSVEISPILLESTDKSEVVSQIRNILNHAIQLTNINIISSLKNNLSLSEFDQILNGENRELVKKIIELQKNVKDAFSDLPSMKREIILKDNNIKLNISGIKIITSLIIKPEFLSGNNKRLVEEELKDIVNEAIRQVQIENNQKIEAFKIQCSELLTEE